MKSKEITTSSKITFPSFHLNPDGLTVTGEPTFEEWQKVGDFIKKSSESVHFWIGDWLNYGEVKWGETYKQAALSFGFSQGTLRDDKWVSSRVPQERRKKELSFSHHRVIADLEEEDQEKLLEDAVKQKLSRDAFTKYVKQWETAGTAPEKPVEKKKVSSEDDNALKSKDILFNADVLLTSIDACNFDTLPSSMQNEIFKKLQDVHRRIDGLFMTYKDES